MLDRTYDLGSWRNRARAARSKLAEKQLGIGSVRILMSQLWQSIELNETGRMQPKDFDRFVEQVQELEARIDLLCAQEDRERQQKAEWEKERQRLLDIFADGQRVPLHELIPKSMDHKLQQESFPVDVLFSICSHILASSHHGDVGDIDWEMQRTTLGWDGTVRVIWMDEYSIWPRVWNFGKTLIDALKAAIDRNTERFDFLKVELSGAHQILAEHVTLIADRPTAEELARLDPLVRLKTLDELRDAITRIDTLMGRVFSNPQLLAGWLEIPPELAQFRHHVLQSEANVTASLPQLRIWFSDLAEKTMLGSDLSQTELALVGERLGPTWEYRLRHLPWLVQLAAISGRGKGSHDHFILIHTLERQQNELDTLRDFFGAPLPRWLANSIYLTQASLNEAVRRDCS